MFDAKLAAEIAQPAIMFILAVTLLVSIYQFTKTSGLTRSAISADILMRLDERFYHTPEMRELRRGAARDLLSKKDPGDAFDQLAGFFDLVGILTRQRVLSDALALSAFYRNAAAFWWAAKECGVIQKRRAAEKNGEFLWSDFEGLVTQLENLRATYGERLSPTELEKILEKNSQL